MTQETENLPEVPLDQRDEISFFCKCPNGKCGVVNWLLENVDETTSHTCQGCGKTFNLLPYTKPESAMTLAEKLKLPEEAASYYHGYDVTHTLCSNCRVEVVASGEPPIEMRCDSCGHSFVGQLLSRMT